MICFSYDPQTPKWGLQDIFSKLKPKLLINSTLKPPFGGLGVIEINNLRNILIIIL